MPEMSKSEKVRRVVMTLGHDAAADDIITETYSKYGLVIDKGDVSSARFDVRRGYKPPTPDAEAGPAPKVQPVNKPAANVEKPETVTATYSETLVPKAKVDKKGKGKKKAKKPVFAGQAPTPKEPKVQKGVRSVDELLVELGEVMQEMQALDTRRVKLAEQIEHRMSENREDFEELRADPLWKREKSAAVEADDPDHQPEETNEFGTGR